MESVVPSSSSSCSPFPPASEYEVFLSFRGADVRKTFADHLYNGLTRSKIRAFRDEEELRKGEGIAPSLIRAIAGSKIYIPILTEHYASSKWCLAELAQMVECCRKQEAEKEAHHLILPIFYFVDPRDVRHQWGPYRPAFQQHAQKQSKQTVGKWKEALQEVGQMKGWHVTESDSQGDIVEQILARVESQLRSMYALVTDELVGIDIHVEEVVKLLNLGSSDDEKVVMVGIHGMGGIGKTTLSKAVYNKICAQFDRCCYLEDVREALAKGAIDGAMALQNQVISTVLKNDCRVKSVSEGINMIKERVCKHKVLIIVDDIDENFEFDKVLGKLGDFSSNSRFIFTTRYKRVLDFLPDCEFYEPGEMSRPHSLQLFSKHAFAMDNPLEEDAGISEEFVRVAAGLPLALKVIGSLLFRRERKFWEEKLIELKCIPSTTENKVQQRLKISYNELTRNEKQIFLDIACFFIGSHIDLPYYMWSSCDFYPESGIGTLIYRSLIKLDESNKFWMHDHIKDLGRAIVKEEDIQHPYNRSRIWSTDDALNMLRNGEGSERVEVLRMDVESRDDSKMLLRSKEFKNLSKLRYLEVQNGRMVGDFSQVLPNLCCLRLPQCRSIPTNINTKKLTILALEGCYVKDNWKGWNGIKAAGRLKAVNLYNCIKLTRPPDLSTCTNLELINFEHCGRMEGQLQIDSFKNLKILKLYYTKITGSIIRGNDIGKLQRLEEMDLRFTLVTELPAGMDGLSSLKILLLESGESCQIEIPELPRSLTRLTISSSNGVPNLLELAELESLSYLNASNPRIPGDLWRLPKLKEFTMMDSCVHGPLLQQEQEATSPAAALPPSLTRLHIEDCGPLNELPSLANLRNLTRLALMDIGAVEIRGLGELRALESMWISDFPNLNNLQGLENLLLLTSLAVEWCKTLERLPSLADLIRLKQLEVGHCPALVEIQGLGDLGKSLSHLEIKACPNLGNLDGQLGRLGALQDLTFVQQSSCPDLSNLVNLKRLNVVQCPQLTEVTGLEKLVALESLNILNCASIRQLPDLSGLKSLKRLDLTHCKNLVNPPTGIDELELLQQLLLYHCRLITKLPNLSGLKNLEKLYLSNCTELTEVEGVEGLESLTELIMSGCRSVKELGNLSGLKNLHHLDIEGCTKLTKVDGVEDLEGLLFLRMGKKLRVKHLVKSVARYVKVLGMGT